MSRPHNHDHHSQLLAEKEKMITELCSHAFPRDQSDEGSWRECVWLDRAIAIIKGEEKEE